MQVQVIDAAVAFHEQPFITPLQLSTGTITVITEARVAVTVRVDGREAEGRGSIYLSDLWAWPDSAYTHDQRDAVLRHLCEDLAARLPDWCGGEAAHPLELGMRLHESACHNPALVGDPDPSVLAKAMCASPFDAAIHDAAGQALGRSAFAFYDDALHAPSVDGFFGGDATAGQAIKAMLVDTPRTTLPAWIVVNKSDGLEEKVAPWVRDRGYRCFKLKIMGQDNAVDVARTVEVYRAVKAFGAKDPWLTIDSNEANPDAASVLDYLERLEAADRGAYDALRYVEQPTSRDVVADPQDWRGVSPRKPVLLDEGLTGMDLLEAATEQGWGGLALKTCKGHSFLLAAAAWAHQRGLIIALQDLTNPGYSFIHGALVAAHLPTVNGAELNSPQFTPAANREWLPRLSALFEPADGLHRLPDVAPPGLGSAL